MKLFQISRISLLCFFNGLADTFRDGVEPRIQTLAQLRLAGCALLGHLRKPPLQLCLPLRHSGQVVFKFRLSLRRRSPAPAPRKNERQQSPKEHQRRAENKLNQGQFQTRITHQRFHICSLIAIPRQWEEILNLAQEPSLEDFDAKMRSQGRGCVATKCGQPA